MGEGKEWRRRSRCAVEWRVPHASVPQVGVVVCPPPLLSSTSLSSSSASYARLEDSLLSHAFGPACPFLHWPRGGGDAPRDDTGEEEQQQQWWWWWCGETLALTADEGCSGETPLPAEKRPDEDPTPTTATASSGVCTLVIPSLFFQRRSPSNACSANLPESEGLPRRPLLGWDSVSPSPPPPLRAVRVPLLFLPHCLVPQVLSALVNTLPTAFGGHSLVPTEAEERRGGHCRVGPLPGALAKDVAMTTLLEDILYRTTSSSSSSASKKKTPPAETSGPPPKKDSNDESGNKEGRSGGEEEMEEGEEVRREARSDHLSSSSSPKKKKWVVTWEQVCGGFTPPLTCLGLGGAGKGRGAGQAGMRAVGTADRSAALSTASASTARGCRATHHATPLDGSPPPPRDGGSSTVPWKEKETKRPDDIPHRAGRREGEVYGVGSVAANYYYIPSILYTNLLVDVKTREKPMEEVPLEGVKAEEPSSSSSSLRGGGGASSSSGFCFASPSCFRQQVRGVCEDVVAQLEKAVQRQVEESGGEGMDFPGFSPTLFICGVGEVEKKEANGSPRQWPTDAVSDVLVNEGLEIIGEEWCAVVARKGEEK